MRGLTMRSSAGGSAAVLILTVTVLHGIAEQVPSPAAQPAAAQRGFPRVPSLPFPTEVQVFETLEGAIRVVPVTAGLVIPWSLAFLPNGDILVTEKGGQLRIVRGGRLDPKPIAGVPPVWTTGQGGLFEVALHPKYAETQVVYLTYAKPGDRGAATALSRGRFDGTTLSDLREIFVADNWGT